MISLCRSSIKEHGVDATYNDNTTTTLENFAKLTEQHIFETIELTHALKLGQHTNSIAKRNNMTKCDFKLLNSFTLSLMCSSAQL